MWRHVVFRRVFKCLLAILTSCVLLTALLRIVPVPFSAYMVESKISEQLSGNLNYQIHYQWVPLHKISRSMQLAVIAAEDQRFPKHYGIDWHGIEAAIKHNEKSGTIRGGSTISQQTIKNLYLCSSRSWLRKGIELPLTLMLETLWSKERILTVYLNIAQFGDGIFGVEAAANHYFHKSASNLTAHESALLAAVLPNPIIYRVNHPTRFVKAKQQWILRQMRALGGISYLKKIK